MTPYTLNRIGTALYGPLWQTQLSRAIGVNDRTVRRWLTGEMAIPEGVKDDLRSLIHVRREQLKEAMRELE